MLTSKTKGIVSGFLHQKVKGIIPLCFLFSASNVFAISLGETVVTAFESNPELSAVYHEYRSSEYAVKEAKSAWLPNLAINASVGHGEQDTPESRAETQQENIRPVSASLTVEQLIFDGFLTSSTIKQRKFENQSNLYLLQSATENTALAIAEAYLNVLQQQQQEKFAQETLRAHEHIYQQIKLRNESGLGSSSELAQVAGRMAKAQANVLAALNNLRDAEAAFTRLVGMPPRNLESPLDDKLIIPPSRAAMLDLARQNHPTIKAAAADVYAAKAAAKSGQSGYYPRVTFEVGQHYNDDRDNPNIDRDELKAELKFTYNLYRGGADKARKRQSFYNLEKVRDAKNDAMRQVIEGAEFSWNAYTMTKQQLGFLNEHVRQSSITREAYEEQFTLGRRTLLDLLDIENEYFEARRSYSSAETRLALAKYRVLNATGTLLENLRISSEEYIKLKRKSR